MLVTLFSLLPIVIILAGTNAWQRDSAESLAGLWACERVFGPEVRGELTVRLQRGELRAAISGYRVPATVEDDRISFSLPADRGEFHGRFSPDRKAIRGHWIQPPAISSDNQFATPVDLVMVGSSAWRGVVVPLEDRLSLYLVLTRRDDGSIGGFLRNPERNLGIFRRFDRVLREGELVRFTRGGSPVSSLTGTYAQESDRLSIRIAPFSEPFVFTRRGRNEALGFFPRTPKDAAYVYRQPIQENDGWKTGALSKLGMKVEPLTRLVQQILDTETTGVTTPYVHSFLIARNGMLVLEEYFYGYHKDKPHDMRSAGKSLASSLIGIAIDRGAHFDAETPVLSLLPQYRELDNPDPRKNRITLEHLMTMSAGLACDEFNGSFPGNENRMQRQRSQPDWYKYILDVPMAHEPGEHAAYCTGTVNLLGAVLQTTTGSSVLDLIRENFAEPLNIRRYHVNLTPLQDAYLGGGIRMRPRDFLKWGQLMLNRGLWNGRRVVSEDWVKRATQPHQGINSKGDYGYNWWLQTYRVADREYPSYNAGGNGGQLVIVIPDLDLVVAFTGGNYSNYPTWRRFRDEFVPRFVIPAVVPTR